VKPRENSREIDGQPAQDRDRARYTRGMTRPVLYYTFGNHMHWVDMQWLWGYDVLPGSVDDMLRLIDATGARGNVNFDAIGYEKMAVDSPEHLAKLRSAVMEGKVEPVGCTYGQPYGLFHGLESNIRQFTHGVRATRRMLGVRPRSFWEEEFCFFPQLPQVLAQCGYTGACLFFQWTWHTPELPKECETLIWWEGSDATRVLALPRGDLNVHQWPEDFEGVMEKALGTGHQASGTGGKATQAAASSVPAASRNTSAECPIPSASSASFPPAIVQWLELMPSKDWMCRSEVLLPRLQELMGDDRFEIRPRTVSALIAELAMQVGAKAGGAESPREQGVDGDGIAVRRYRMDDVWHGMTLGKNADAHPRASSETEAMIRSAEALAATVSLLGRPYPSWDVYPTWELDEAWRELLAAQHHDNHECEGLCGFVGHHQMERAQRAAAEVMGRAIRLLEMRRPAGLRGELTVNTCSWERVLSRVIGSSSVPGLGYRVVPYGPEIEDNASGKEIRRTVTLRAGSAEAVIDTSTGELVSLVVQGSTISGRSLGLRMNGAEANRVSVKLSDDEEGVWVDADHEFDDGTVTVSIGLEEDGLVVEIDMEDDDGAIPIKPGPGIANALTMGIDAANGARLFADVPGGIDEVSPSGTFKRKYPRGDWMISPQWFEDVVRPFTSQSLVDVVRGEDGAGVLIVHDGSQQWLRRDGCVHVVLTAYDPWDEQRYGVEGWTRARLWIRPHPKAMTNVDLQRIAADLIDRARGVQIAMNAEPVGGGTPEEGEEVPTVFAPLEVRGSSNVTVTAFHRESMKSGEHLHAWAGHRMARESDGKCTHPFVVRLMEWNGEPAEVELVLAGEVACAAKTNLLGEVFGDEPPRTNAGGGWSMEDTGWLNAEPCEPPPWAIVEGQPISLFGTQITWSCVRFTMRPREIATIYADMVMGRKQFRDLDAKRAVWATIHKMDGPKN
jgi:alpha-mannosidase